jgi:hypothetical protein
MPIHKPEKGTEEEKVYNWWWGGSIWEDPKPDEVTYSVMNEAYDLHKKYGDSEEKIKTLPETNPRKFISHGMLRYAQWDALRKNPAEREAKNAELRN